MLYAPIMPDHTSVLDKPITRVIGKANIGNRLNAAELRTTIHDSGIAYLAIEMAKTGRRPTSYDEETGKFIYEQMSEAAHIDMIKFIVKKILPDAKEIATVDQKSLDHWAGVISAEAEAVKKS